MSETELDREEARLRAHLNKNLADNRLIRAVEGGDPDPYADLLDHGGGRRRADLKIDGVALHALARLIRAAMVDIDAADEHAAEEDYYRRAEQRLAEGLDPVTGEPRTFQKAADRRCPAETVPRVMINATTGERQTIQLAVREGMTAAAVGAFIAERREAGKLIDVQNCMIAEWSVEALDPYGLLDVGDWSCIGRTSFVRGLPDGDWVLFEDLPEATRKAFYEARREHHQRDVEAAKPRAAAIFAEMDANPALREAFDKAWEERRDVLRQFAHADSLDRLRAREAQRPFESSSFRSTPEVPF